MGTPDRHRPRTADRTSIVGIALTTGSLAICPWLGIAKARREARLAAKGEGTKNMLCGYLATATLIGFAANTTAGIWWLDPIAGLVIAGVCVHAGRNTWRGEQCSCATCTPVL